MPTKEKAEAVARAVWLGVRRVHEVPYTFPMKDKRKNFTVFSSFISEKLVESGAMKPNI